MLRESTPFFYLSFVRTCRLCVCIVAIILFSVAAHPSIPSSVPLPSPPASSCPLIHSAASFLFLCFKPLSVHLPSHSFVSSVPLSFSVPLPSIHPHPSHPIPSPRLPCPLYICCIFLSTDGCASV